MSLRPPLPIALLAALLPGVALAQVPRFAVSTNLVVLSATAVDRHGRPVQNLGPKDFQIF